MACNYQLPSNVNFGGGVSGSCLTNPLAGYTNAYNTYLNAAQSNWNNVMQGYSQLASGLQAGIAPISQGYQNLTKEVLCGIKGVQQSQLNAVQCQFTKASGATQQQLIGAGLGNSTVLGSAQRGNVAQEALASTQVQNQFAQLQAGYQSQLGLACLNWQQQALGMQQGLGNQQLQTMAGTSSRPPTPLPMLRCTTLSAPRPLPAAVASPRSCRNRLRRAGEQLMRAGARERGAAFAAVALVEAAVSTVAIADPAAQLQGAAKAACKAAGAEEVGAEAVAGAVAAVAADRMDRANVLLCRRNTNLQGAGPADCRRCSCPLSSVPILRPDLVAPRQMQGR